MVGPSTTRPDRHAARVTDSPIDRIVLRRVVHQLVAQRLIDRVFNQRLIGNVERGAYVECMVDLALSELHPPWSLTGTWESWDLVQEDTGARIEVKQSAARQTWSSATNPARHAPTFDIAPRSGYYIDGGSEWVESDLRRHADVYIMGWHGENDPQIADHRRPDQWQFYVVPEHRLPPGQKTISLNPLASLGHACSYAELAGAVRTAVDELPGLKAERPVRSE